MTEDGRAMLSHLEQDTQRTEAAETWREVPEAQ